MNFIAYYRVSTKKQGLGLDAQRESVQRQVGDSILLAEYQEKESGKVTSRPELQKALRHCQATGATLVIAKLDRLARNTAFISALMESGVEFICCDMPHANKLMIHIMAAFAEHEADIISQRTKAGLGEIKRRIKREGVYVSKAGNEITRLGTHTLRTSEEYAQIGKRGAAASARARRVRKLERSGPAIERALVLRGEGLSFRLVALRLNSEGYRTSKGREYSGGYVCQLLEG